MKQKFFAATIFSTAVLGNGYPVSAQSVDKPNIIIIFTDDHGFTDFGLHGIDANVQTPVLDSLAANGALMKNGYATAPQCVPSRAGLMTGRIQNTFGTRQNGDIYGRTPVPLTVPTIAERLLALGGYRTGMVGKWHLEIPSTVPDGDFPGTREDYLPANRGFQEYWYGTMSPYKATFDLAGNTLTPEQTISDSRNRVIVQGEAAQAFIRRNKDNPFFLYLALYGPHVPLIGTNDTYYLNFPELDYPNYDSELDDIRRKGLALVKAVDDAAAGVIQTLRDLGLEENTLIFFAGDNGAQPKFWDVVGGAVTRTAWNGSENIPLRGEKGSLWEGGMKVPMFAYWKNHILSNQVIEEPVSTLDFTATILKLAGGVIPSEFDGMDILPRLTGETNTLVRLKPLFWDWGQEVAVRDGDWKFHRIGNRTSLLNLAEDPYELYDLKYVYPGKFAEMEAVMMNWYTNLPPEGRSDLAELGDNLYVLGAPAKTPVDPRFVIPYTNAASAAYPAPLQILNDPDRDTDGDGMKDVDESAAGRNPESASDLAFEFSADGNLEGWTPILDGHLNSYTVTNGFLTGESFDNQGRFERYDFNFDADQIDNILVRIRAEASLSLVFRWGHTLSNVFAAARTIVVSYASNQWQTVVIPLAGLPEWDGHTITKFRLNPVSGRSGFTIDCIRGSTGDLDGDLLPDLYEWQNGLDAGDAADGNTDSDGDGMTLGQEYIAGTSASDPASVFTVQNDKSAVGVRPGLHWGGKAGRAYSVWSTPQLVDPIWAEITNMSTLNADQTVEFTDTSGVPSQLFYQVKVQKP